MGVAAYERGSKLIRRQIEADNKKPASAWQIAMEAQEQKLKKQADEIERLQSELERAKKGYIRRNAEVKALKQEKSELVQEVDRLFSLASERGRENAELNRRWQLTSHMLRENFSREEIDCMKEEVYLRFPFMRRQDSAN